MKNIDSDLIRGNIDTIILTTMLDGDKYGLDIIKEVEIRSNGTYELKQPTLYSCLKRLENQELISSYWLDSDIGGRRHYYKLTEKGKESLLQKQEEWAKSKFIIDNLLSNHNYEEYRLVKKEDYDKIIEGKQFEYSPENSPSSTTTPDTTDEVDETENDENNDEEIVLDENVNHFENLEDADDDISENDNLVETFDEVEEDESDENEIDKLTENEESYVFNDDDSVSEKRIDYNDDSDDAEADYPNQKRFKIPSIYDKITIDENVSLEDEPEEDFEESEEISEEDDDETVVSIYSEFDTDEDSLDESDENEEDEPLYDDFDLGTNADEDDEEDSSPVYYSHYDEETADEDDDLNVPISQPVDQSQNELNILARLRKQEDEEINEYVGDKNSYINHLNQNDEIENLKRDDLNVVQEDLLSADYLSQSTIDSKINEFTSAIDELNKFSSEPYGSEIKNAIEDDEIIEMQDVELEEELINDTNSHEESEDIIEFKENTQETLEDFDSYLDELKELENNENNGFFNSLDSSDYAQQNKFQSEFNTVTFDSLDDFDESDSSDASFEKQVEDYNNQYGYNQTSTDKYEEETYSKSVQELDDEIADNFASFDEIISRSANDYTSNTTNYVTNDEYQTFTPRFTENNYKQKLSNLSAYSKVNVDEPVQEHKESSEEIMNKVKDIQTLRAEFAEEGICVKEYKKANGHDDVDRTYLLSNKINLVKSLILLFGYVFVLSAVYIIMNNTSANTIHNFSFKYFLFGFIPFGIYALYHTVMFVISPYKKVPAKFAPRIMIFISVIITIQLLLITYCVNLQLGFYSFSQSHYNHLIWVIPTIISFAPIISNLIYMALYYSKNFNV
ncbi:MAG: helix-turn-helix transcriptional regulator [Clostridia bacterium]|nr:helix-turn-helix transcriptional regulator [Clostridia bacterium]